MKILKSLRFLLIIGNVLLAFRNLSSISGRNRFFVIFVILFDTLLSFCNTIICIYFELYYRFADITFVHALFLNSTLFVLLSCYHAGKFKDMLTLLEANSEIVNNDNIYLKNFGKENTKFKVILIAYIGLKVLLPIYNSRYTSLTYTFPYIAVIILKFNSLFWDLRYVYEYFLMCMFVCIFSEQLECIIRSIVKHKRLVGTNFQLTDTSSREFICNQYVDKISEWFQALTNLTEAIKLFNTIFGLQLTVMLISATFYVSLFLYDIAVLSVRHEYENAIIVMHTIRIFVILVAILVLSRAGQRLSNNVEILKRRIGKVYILSIADDKFLTAAKDILEYISSGQMRIQALGPIEVDMRLLPTFIMLFTSYTVVALQFNNVL